MWCRMRYFSLTPIQERQMSSVDHKFTLERGSRSETLHNILGKNHMNIVHTIALLSNSLKRMDSRLLVLNQEEASPAQLRAGSACFLPGLVPCCHSLTSSQRYVVCWSYKTSDLVNAYPGGLWSDQVTEIRTCLKSDSNTSTCPRGHGRVLQRDATNSSVSSSSLFGGQPVPRK